MSGRPIPLQFTWDDDERMTPVGRTLGLCRDEFGLGEVITFERHEERSTASHNHYFASIKTAWETLPENEMHRFPTEDILRKWSLIKAGYCDSKTIVLDSNHDALVVAAYLGNLPDYGIV